MQTSCSSVLPATVGRCQNHIWGPLEQSKQVGELIHTCAHTHTDTHPLSAKKAGGMPCMQRADSGWNNLAWFIVMKLSLIGGKQTENKMLWCLSLQSYIQSVWVMRERAETRMAVGKSTEGGYLPKNAAEVPKQQEGLGVQNKRLKDWEEKGGNWKETRKQGYTIFYSNAHWIRILYAEVRNKKNKQKNFTVHVEKGR